VHLLIVAKEPRPGFAKTRLIPRFGAEGAAALARAALADTFATAAACAADRVVVAFDGDPTGLVPSGFEVVPQRDGGFDRRLTGAWEDAGGPGLQIGMDTPQLTTADLDGGLELLAAGADAVLGPALDGGWWAIGFQQPHPRAFIDLPMSRPDTAEHQLARLAELGLRPHLLAERHDVDEPDDALAVADAHPGTRFAEVLAGLLAAEPALAER
jgi:rSAM/selenodomain-associated transferase 1